MEDAVSFLKQLGGRLRSLGTPQTASKLTILVQVALALVKLPAGLLSGSVGLLNDSFDTILDFVSSLLVYLGVRFNRERIASIMLVACMTATSGFTLYEAVRRIFVVHVPRVEWFPFFAALLSAASGLSLWQYQRYVGRRSGSMAFIAESVDSRNHVFVALGVTAGLVASLLGFGLLDVLVGLAVALLILWSAIELVIELFRSSGGEEVNLTRYGLWLREVFHNARDRLLINVMSGLIERGDASTKAELIERVRRAVDFRENPWMHAVGLDRQIAPDAVIESVIEECMRRNLFADCEPLVLSERAKELLARQTRNRRHRVAFPLDRRAPSG
jgi:hypothetical protein